MEESRKQFEKWIANTTNSDLHRGIMLDRRDCGSYRHLATENKWEAWQASRQAIEIEMPPRKAAYASGYGDGYLVEQQGGEAIDYDEMVEVLRAAGLRIKGE